MTRDVVVGVGFEPDERVVRWAAAEARERDLRLRLVHALVLPVGHHLGWALAAAPGLRRRAHGVLAEAAATAREVAPDLEIETAVQEGGPAPVLRGQAAHAAMVVVGSDGLGRVGDLLLGGVVRGLLGHVDAPVVVVPVGYDPTVSAEDHPPVLVWDDGTPGCTGAWRFAADRAHRRGVPLVAVRVGTEKQVDRALVERARGANALVLGVAGSWLHHRAASGVVRQAACPVVIVPPLPAIPAPVDRATSTAGRP